MNANIDKCSNELNTPLTITVITVCRNAAQEIEDTILSVIDQTYSHLEYIIIDGASTDGTVEIIKKYAEGGSEADMHTHRISKWISEPDNGIYDAMNKGIVMATGDYINFMNAGDSFYDAEVLKNVAERTESDAIIVYGQNLKVYNRFSFISDPHPVNLNELKHNARLPHQAMFVNAIYHKKNLFDLRYRSASDYNLYYNAYFKDSCKIQYLNVLVSKYDAEKGMSKDSYLGTVESLNIQGVVLSKNKIIFLKLKYKVLNYLKETLPESIITAMRIRKFKKMGLTIIRN